jgi:hypothetical protein
MSVKVMLPARGTHQVPTPLSKHLIDWSSSTPFLHIPYLQTPFETLALSQGGRNVASRALLRMALSRILLFLIFECKLGKPWAQGAALHPYTLRCKAAHGVTSRQLPPQAS